VRKTVALDAHILMLLAVGAVNVAYIAKHKRLQGYRVKHFDVLRELVDQAPAVASTTHALTEASNLLRLCRDPMRSEIMTGLAGIVAVIEELTPAASQVCAVPEFLRLGLTDAAFTLLDPKRYGVISADIDLILALQMRGFEVVNFHTALFD
jgi:hypothetical protein